MGTSVFVFLFEEAGAAGAAVAPALQYPIVGETAAIRHGLDFIGQVAPLDATVLIAGEKGTGKELVARALHDSGLRARKPFVMVNCASLSETFLDRELFGYERAHFPGALTRKEGKLELAEGGTLFLNEVAALPLALQSKLLRLLHEKRFQRLGAGGESAADVRVIAATDRDLAAASADGSFGQDLTSACACSPSKCRRCDSAAKTFRPGQLFSSGTKRPPEAPRAGHYRRGARLPVAL